MNSVPGTPTDEYTTIKMVSGTDSKGRGKVVEIIAFSFLEKGAEDYPPMCRQRILSTEVA